MSETARQESGHIRDDFDHVEKDVNANFDSMEDDARQHMEQMSRDVGRETGNAESHFSNLRDEANRRLGEIHVPDLDVRTSYNVDIHWDYDEFKMPGGDGVPLMQHGGIIDRPTLIMGGEGGQPEMIGPVGFMSEALRGAMGSGQGQGKNEVVSELQSLREEIELLPIHIRDAIITSQ